MLTRGVGVGPVLAAMDLAEVQAEVQAEARLDTRPVADPATCQAEAFARRESVVFASERVECEVRPAEAAIAAEAQAAEAMEVTAKVGQLDPVAATTDSWFHLI